MLRLTARPLLSRPLASRLLVSVVVPCYNYGRYLPAAVASALDQPGIDVEVIIVDDASTDGSADIAERLAAADSRVTLVRHERNQGHIATYNDGLARVAGELVVLLSADDLLAPGALTRAAALFEARPEVGLVYGRVVEFSEPSAVSTVRIGARGSWTVWRGREWIGLATWRGRNFILSPEAVVRTSALRRAGGYNPELPHSGDLEYWLRVAAGSAVGRINGPVQAFYRVHGGNMHALRFASAAADLRHRVAAFAVLGAIVAPKEAGARLAARSRRAVGREALITAARCLAAGGSAAEAAELVGVAEAARPGASRTLRGRLVAEALRRAERDLAPTVAARWVEAVRRQADRGRWRLWKAVGVS